MRLSKLLLWGLLAVVVPIVGCERGKSESEEQVAPAHASVKGLTIDAEKRERLGIQVMAVESVKWAGALKRVGWLVAPPGTETTIRSPVAGFIVPSTADGWPRIGTAISANSLIALVNVFLSPQELSQLVLAKEDNDIQMQQALVTMQLSESQLKLATAAKDAVTGVRLDQIREAYERSKAAYKEAQDKLPYLIQEPYENGLLVKPVSISAATGGRILQIHVSEGQFVQAGDPLWTVSSWETLWLRVPVFAPELQKVLADKPAIVVSPDRTQSTAEPLNVPTTVQSTTRMVDLLYSVTNSNWALRVGQSTVVELPTSHEEDTLVIPNSAVLYDGFGQAACYAAEAGSDLFRRKRIELGMSRDNKVAVLRGLDADDVVISMGAEQLAAEETKSELSMEDDD